MSRHRPLRTIVNHMFQQGVEPALEGDSGARDSDEHVYADEHTNQGIYGAAVTVCHFSVPRVSPASSTARSSLITLPCAKEGSFGSMRGWRVFLLFLRASS